MNPNTSMIIAGINLPVKTKYQNRCLSCNQNAHPALRHLKWPPPCTDTSQLSNSWHSFYSLNVSNSTSQTAPLLIFYYCLFFPRTLSHPLSCSLLSIDPHIALWAYKARYTHFFPLFEILVKMGTEVRGTDWVGQEAAWVIVVVTQMYMHVKIQQVITLRAVHFIVSMLFLNKKKA